MQFNQGNKFGTLKKPMFSVFDEINFGLIWDNNKKNI